jgi:hypothetical protein
VNDDAVIFLERCESNGMTLVNYPPYIGEWIKSNGNSTQLSATKG